MRNEKLIPGIILVTVGALFLLHNFGYIYFSWGNFFRLWPVLLLIAGVNLVFAHSRSAWATAIKVLVIVFGIGLFVFACVGDGMYHHHFQRFGNQNYDTGTADTTDTTETDSVIANSSTGTFFAPYKANITSAVLNLSGGATTYTINGTTNALFSAHAKNTGKAENTLTTSDDDSIATIDFTMNNNHSHIHGFSFDLDGKSANKAFIKLNTNPLWDINVETGASKMNLNLSPFKVKHLKVEGGAAAFDVLMGEPLAETDIDVSTGASDVNIAIPKDAACHITTDTGLSSKSFDSFNNVSDNEYETAGFAKASRRIYIKIEGAVSSFKVKRY